MSAEKAEAGLVAADVLVVRWWLEVRPLVKTAVVCQSDGSSSQIEDFQRSLKVLIYCVDFLRL